MCLDASSVPMIPKSMLRMSSCSLFEPYHILCLTLYRFCQVSQDGELVVADDSSVDTPTPPPSGKGKNVS